MCKSFSISGIIMSDGKKQTGYNFCRGHSARTDNDHYRVCPSKLKKHELEDLYFALADSNLVLKKTINNQEDEIKVLSTKLQRATATAQKAGLENKNCCPTHKAIIEEQKNVIADKKKSNDRLTERVRLLSMKLCSVKQFLKRNISPGCTKTCYLNTAMKNSSLSGLNTKRCDTILKSNDASFQYMDKATTLKKLNDSVSSNNSLTKPNQPVCEENKWKSLVAELRKQITTLEDELSKTHKEYMNRIEQVEDEVHKLKLDKARVRAEHEQAETRLQKQRTESEALLRKLRDAETQYDNLAVELTMEQLRARELRTRLRATRTDGPSHITISGPETPERLQLNTSQGINKSADDSGYTESSLDQRTSDKKNNTYFGMNLTSTIASLQAQFDAIRGFVMESADVEPNQSSNPNTDGSNTEQLIGEETTEIIPPETPTARKVLFNKSTSDNLKNWCVLINRCGDYLEQGTKMVNEKFDTKDQDLEPKTCGNIVQSTKTKEKTITPPNKNDDITESNNAVRKPKVCNENRMSTGTFATSKFSIEEELCETSLLSKDTSQSTNEDEASCSKTINKISTLIIKDVGQIDTTENKGCNTNDDKYILDSKGIQISGGNINLEYLNPMEGKLTRSHRKEKKVCKEMAVQKTGKIYASKESEERQNLQKSTANVETEVEDLDVTNDSMDTKLPVGGGRNHAKRRHPCVCRGVLATFEKYFEMDNLNSSSSPKHDTYVIHASSKGNSTEREISSMSDLPTERNSKSGEVYISPGEYRRHFSTDSSTTTTTDYASLSEGELPVGENKMSYGELKPKSKHDVVRPTPEKAQDVFVVIKEEMKRCKDLLHDRFSEVNIPFPVDPCTF